MTAPFVTELRVSGSPIRLAPAGAASMPVRVEMPDVWRTVLIEALPETPVLDLKLAALRVLQPRAEFAEDFVLKLRGWEVLDERATLQEIGAVSGSIFLLGYRRRRPVR